MSEQQDQAAPTDGINDDEMVVLFSSETADGKPFFCYIKMTAEKFLQYSEEAKHRNPDDNLDLTSLGEIVAKGWGEMPSDEFHAAVLNKFGPVQQAG